MSDHDHSWRQVAPWSERLECDYCHEIGSFAQWSAGLLGGQLWPDDFSKIGKVGLDDGSGDVVS